MVVDQNPKKSSAFLELGILNMEISKEHDQSLHYLDEAIKLGKPDYLLILRSASTTGLSKQGGTLSHDV